MAESYGDRFKVECGKRVALSHWDTSFHGKHDSHEKALPEIAEHVNRMSKLQYLLYANHDHALLIVLQGLDAAGKDGVVRHVFSGVNPQGCMVTAFKAPTEAELGHDFLWRVHAHAPQKGMITIFNRSHYEDVLVTRVHGTISAEECRHRYEIINQFERLLVEENKTKILKFYLHISPEEQLARFKKRLDDPERQWKISESDYKERTYWPDYIEAFQDALAATSTEYAPWYVIPSDHKWFRDLVVSQLITEALDSMGLSTPQARVDLAAIRRRYHAEAEQRSI